MCGRSSLTKTEKEIEKRFNAHFYSEDLEQYLPIPNYNIAPTHYCPLITHEEPSIIKVFRWGLLPFWAKKSSEASRYINLRKETIENKKVFSGMMQSKRCLIPLDGFYEWKKSGKEKLPYRITTTNQEIFSVAGIWSIWKSSETTEEIPSFTLITIEANKFMNSIHDRMPAILLPENEKLWLDDSLSTKELLQLLLPYPDKQMRMYRVSTKVNNVRNNSADLIEKISETQTQEIKFPE
jgi:putative SOS response-associated peptidase YedK